MSNQIPLFGRASDIDDQGDIIVVPEATAYFYESGSTTPLVVYSDSGLTTPLGTSVQADQDGLFPNIWTAETKVLIDVLDGSGTSLDGFPQDDVLTIPEGGQSASSIVATPTAGNPGTTVENQINNNTSRLNRMDNASNIPTSGGSAGAYTLISQYPITSYVALMEREFISNQVSVGSDTLNVDGQGAVALQKYVTSTTKAAIGAGDIQIGQVVRVKFDGTDFVVVSPLNATEAGPGLVEAASQAEMDAGTAGKYPDAAKIRTFFVGNTGWELVQTFYDSSTNGLVSNIVTPDFETGYDYAVEIYNLFGDTGTTTVTGQLYRSVVDAYDTAATLKSSNANYFSAWYEFLNPMASRLQHWIKFAHTETAGTGALSFGVTAGEGMFTIRHAANDQIERFRIQRGAGSINNGVARMYRRPTQIS